MKDADGVAMPHYREYDLSKCCYKSATENNFHWSCITHDGQSDSVWSFLASTECDLVTKYGDMDRANYRYR